MSTIKVDRAFRNKFAQVLSDTDFVIGANKVTVNKSNGNTAIAGTLAVTGAVALGDDVTLAAGADLVASATGAGSMIGTGATQKLAFWGATPVAQPSGATQAALTDNSGGASGGNTIAVVTDNTSAANAIATLAAKVNVIRAALVTLGLIKGSA